MQWLRTALASALVLALGVGVLAWATEDFQAFTSTTAQRVKVARDQPQVPATELQTQSGGHVNLGAMRGQWLLVDFVYTHCVDFCSVLGAKYTRLQHTLATPLADHKLRFLSISFDRARDTPEALSSYIRASGGIAGTWLATRPTSAGGLHRLERTFGVTVIPDGHGGFTHSAAINLVAPDGRLVHVFGLDASVATINRVVHAALQ